MAGHHQIWTLDLAKKECRALRRQRPGEHRATARWLEPCFAQPSGLTTDGKTLYVADSEVERRSAPCRWTARAR